MKAIKNNQQFTEVLSEGKPVVLDFYADWCGPCQTLLPMVEKLSVEYDNKVEVRKVNVDQNNELAARFKVRSIPALFFIKDSKIVDQLVGVAPQFQLREKLDALLD